MSPLPEDEVFSGIFSLKQTSVVGHTLATCATACDAAIGQSNYRIGMHSGRASGVAYPE